MNFNLALALGLPEDVVEDLGVVTFPEVVGAGLFLLLLVGPLPFWVIGYLVISDLWSLLWVPLLMEL